MSLQYGRLPNDDSAFRALCMLLARHPTYAQLPLKRTLEFLSIIRDGHNFCAFEDKKLRGVVLWHEVPNAVAVECVGARKMPRPSQCVRSGDAVATLCFIAPSPQQVRAIWNAFAAMQKGRIVLFERHAAGKEPRFMWLDRAGKALGQDVS